jgi:hypothetical protein
LGGYDQKIEVPGHPRQIIQEIPSSKWTGGVAQGQGCLLCKCEALRTNPGPTQKNLQKKKKKGRKEILLFVCFDFCFLV